MAESRVGEIYAPLKEMAVNYHLKPGEKINEAALAKSLETSRTPLREALNRLVAERFFEFQSGKGFYCRELDTKTVFELYETREIIEEASVRRACERGSDAAIAKLKEFLLTKGMDYSGLTVGQSTQLDETFHVSIALLTGNDELVRQLQHLNERIRFIRWIDLSTRVLKTKGEHLKIMRAIEARDAEKATAAMRVHIEVRMDRIVAIVKEGFSNIYVKGPQELQETLIEVHQEP